MAARLSPPARARAEEWCRPVAVLAGAGQSDTVGYDNPPGCVVAIRALAIQLHVAGCRVPCGVPVFPAAAAAPCPIRVCRTGARHFRRAVGGPGTRAATAFLAAFPDAKSNSRYERFGRRSENLRCGTRH